MDKELELQAHLYMDQAQVDQVQVEADPLPVEGIDCRMHEQLLAALADEATEKPS